ncbi:hypothetical protein [Ruegeria sp. TM1040]|uniref:hypothetical protein n=1 Tax=Ruegeria sp. (strain TM1040) TaxID=292414 RepID=UPI00140FEFD6|nr:hypothetical protein [Ruegeria sp. TM1040]
MSVLRIGMLLWVFQHVWLQMCQYDADRPDPLSTYHPHGREIARHIRVKGELSRKSGAHLRAAGGTNMSSQAQALRAGDRSEEAETV